MPTNVPAVGREVDDNEFKTANLIAQFVRDNNLKSIEANLKQGKKSPAFRLFQSHDKLRIGLLLHVVMQAHAYMGSIGDEASDEYIQVRALFNEMRNLYLEATELLMLSKSAFKNAVVLGQRLGPFKASIPQRIMPLLTWVERPMIPSPLALDLYKSLFVFAKTASIIRNDDDNGPTEVPLVEGENPIDISSLLKNLAEKSKAAIVQINEVSANQNNLALEKRLTDRLDELSSLKSAEDQGSLESKVLKARNYCEHVRPNLEQLIKLKEIQTAFDSEKNLASIAGISPPDDEKQQKFVLLLYENCTSVELDLWNERLDAIKEAKKDTESICAVLYNAVTLRLSWAIDYCWSWVLDPLDDVEQLYLHIRLRYNARFPLNFLDQLHHKPLDKLILIGGLQGLINSEMTQHGRSVG